MASRYDEVTSITVAMMPCRVDKYSFIVSERLLVFIVLLVFLLLKIITDQLVKTHSC